MRQLFNLGTLLSIMGEARIDNALDRLSAALSRVDVAKSKVPNANLGSSEARENSKESVSALVNQHEKLREEVAETLREIDLLIEEHDS
ncbi:MAG: hypothetical protein AAGK17_08280 [Pseudomonadota bacterium]